MRLTASGPFAIQKIVGPGVGNIRLNRTPWFPLGKSNEMLGTLAIPNEGLHFKTMAKKSSDDIVNDEAEMQRRFEKLEEDSAESKDLLSKIAAKVLGTAAPPPDKKDDGKPPSKIKPSGIKAILPFLFSPEE